jgi:hypothetical protein
MPVSCRLVSSLYDGRISRNWVYEIYSFIQNQRTWSSHQSPSSIYLWGFRCWGKQVFWNFRTWLFCFGLPYKATKHSETHCTVSSVFTKYILSLVNSNTIVSRDHACGTTNSWWNPKSARLNIFILPYMSVYVIG